MKKVKTIIYAPGYFQAELQKAFVKEAKVKGGVSVRTVANLKSAEKALMSDTGILIANVPSAFHEGAEHITSMKVIKAARTKNPNIDIIVITEGIGDTTVTDPIRTIAPDARFLERHLFKKTFTEALRGVQDKIKPPSAGPTTPQQTPGGLAKS